MNNTLKKVTGILATAILAIGLIAGCGGSDKKADNKAPAKADVIKRLEAPYVPHIKTGAY